MYVGKGSYPKIVFLKVDIRLSKPPNPSDVFRTVLQVGSLAQHNMLKPLSRL